MKQSSLTHQCSLHERREIKMSDFDRSRFVVSKSVTGHSDSLPHLFADDCEVIVFGFCHRFHPMINFINILGLHFSYESALLSFFYLNVIRERLQKRLLYENSDEIFSLKLPIFIFKSGKYIFFNWFQIRILQKKCELIKKYSRFFFNLFNSNLDRWNNQLSFMSE